jgi:hypothetical protein
MTCSRVRADLAAGLPMEALLDHVESCRDCQFYLENTVHMRDLSVPVPQDLCDALGKSPRGLSCEEALQVLAGEEFQRHGSAEPHLEHCAACREAADAFTAYVTAAKSIRMPARLRHRLEGVTEERGVSIFGRILPYVAAFLLSASLTLFFATKGNLSQEAVKLQEKAYQTKGAAVSTYGKIVGFLARNLDKEDTHHELHKSSGN